MRLAWFSPFPPARSGVAGRSDETVQALRARGYDIDIYVAIDAHDFVWRHARQPYDLIVYQFGNSSHHDYEWPYALRYPGLVVLHDTRLHHARAAALLRERRAAEYRAELAWNHPELNPDLAELAIAGFDSTLYYDWPMLRMLVTTSRLTAAHGRGAAHEIARALPEAADRVVSIRLGEGELVTPERARGARARIRARYGIADEATVFGCFGGLTPEKRVFQILDACHALGPTIRSLHLMLAGAAAAPADLAAAIRARALQDRVTMTGYLESDAELTDHLAACDVSLNLRWPTARETSGPWLRALAAGLPTVITDLVHLGDVPALDPRTWGLNFVGTRDPECGPRVPDPACRVPDPLCISIDLLDEDHSLRLAMRRLAADADLRARLGRAAQQWWAREHSVAAMIDDYDRIVRDAASRPAPVVELPAHARRSGTDRLRALAAPFGLVPRLSADGLLE